MEKDTYVITGTFICNGIKMLVIRTNGSACTMPEKEYNRIIITERKYNQRKVKAV